MRLPSCRSQSYTRTCRNPSAWLSWIHEKADPIPEPTAAQPEPLEQSDVEPDVDGSASVMMCGPGTTEESLRISVRDQDALSDRFLIEFDFDFRASGQLKLKSGNRSEERLFLRVLDLAVERKLGNELVLTKKMFPACKAGKPGEVERATEAIRSDFSDLLVGKKTRLDPIFVVTGGKRGIRVNPGSIHIEPSLFDCSFPTESEYWELIRKRLRIALDS